MTQLDIRQLAEQGGVNPIAPVTVPEAVKFENGADLTTAIGSIATIETSPATATHAVGDYIVWNGQLYKVISAIAVGATLTVGTNISATSAGSELTSLKSDLTKEASSFFTTYPNGHLYNVNYFVITVPFMNLSRTTPTIISGYVYTPTGGFADITSSIAIETVYKMATNVRITFNDTYIGKLLRITLE